MAKKKKPETNETEIKEPVDTIPVVTPEIEDGYNGIIKRLVCSACQRVFYLTDADYQTLHPTHCHSCSIKLIAEYEAKKQQERTEQEKKKRGEIIRAVLDDMQKLNKDTSEEDRIRSLVETKNPKNKNYGFEMILCIPRHTEQGKAWDVTLVKDEEHLKRSINRRIRISEFGTNAYFVLPYGDTISYETTLEVEIKQLDAAIAQYPTQSLRYAVKAEKLAELGDNQQALQWYDKAIEIDTSSTYAYTMKGKLLERLDRPGEAMECYEKVISLEPDETFGYDCKARLLEKLGRVEEAITLYDAFIAAHPTDLQGYLQKALLFISQRKFEEAQAIHQQGKLAVQNVN